VGVGMGYARACCTHDVCLSAEHLLQLAPSHNVITRSPPALLVITHKRDVVSACERVPMVLNDAGESVCVRSILWWMR
jgi:hypothetical protein